MRDSAQISQWKGKSLSLVQLFSTHGLYSPWTSPGQNTGMGRLFLLQGIFPTQESNQSLSCGRSILYWLSHNGSPRILEWVAYPFSSRSSCPRNWTGVSWILYQLSYEGSPMKYGFESRSFWCNAPSQANSMYNVLRVGNVELGWTLGRRPDFALLLMHHRSLMYHHPSAQVIQVSISPEISGLDG